MARRKIRTLFIASECVPLAKTGGLADVVGALPSVLAGLDCETRVLLPGYRGLPERLSGPREALSIKALFGGPVRVLSGEAGELHLLLVDAPHLYRRGGSLYQGPGRQDWHDNHRRFAALAWLGSRIGQGVSADGWVPDVVHAHDWQAGLAPLYLRGAKARPATVFTIHNIAYQGIFPPDTATELLLPVAEFKPHGYEFYGNISFLKAGLVYADAITTVSPTYARELRDPAFGMRLDGVIRERWDRVSGILNGIDASLWNPSADPFISPYSASGPAARRANKRALLSEFRLGSGQDRPLFAVVSRLTEQKGLDLLLAAMPELLATGADFLLLGTGDSAMEAAFTNAAHCNPGRISVRIGYDEALAHRIYAGADAMLVPSRFEPCGLSQLYALRYGALPVVARTGGLADTVIDANAAALSAGVATGFLFEPGSKEALAATLNRASELYRDRRAWRRMQRNAMKQDLGWERSAERYRELYGRLIRDRQQDGLERCG